MKLYQFFMIEIIQQNFFDTLDTNFKYGYK